MTQKNEERPLTPEELRWRAAAWDPEKARRNLKWQYTLSGCNLAALIGWGILMLCSDDVSISDWFIVLSLVLSLTSLILGIVNNKRILAGKRPWGDII